MAVKEHLSAMLGSSPRLLAESGNTRVFFWEDRECEDVGIVCTVGMSACVQPIASGASCPSREPRTELLAFCHFRYADDVARMLLDLARYPFENTRHVFWWQTIPMGRAITADSQLDGLLLSMPPYAADEVTFHVNGSRIDLLWVVPIAGSERDYCERYGVEALELLLDDPEVDIADLARVS